MIVVDMRSLELPYVHLAYFGGIVLDKISQDSNELWILHLSVIQPIDLTSTDQLNDILELFTHIAKRVVDRVTKVTSYYRKVIISGRVPLALLLKLEFVAVSVADCSYDSVYVYDPKIGKGFNYKLETIEISDELKVKLTSTYDELVRQRHQS